MLLGKCSVMESAVPRRSWVNMSKAADASWSIPWSSGSLSIDKYEGPRAGLGRADGASGKVGAEGTRVRGENEGEVSDI